MLSIKQTASFKKDLKRESAGESRIILKERLWHIVAHLADCKPLAVRYYDHDLKGDWQGYRECHIAPDLLLLYRTTDEILTLVRLGSHSEIFGK